MINGTTYKIVVDAGTYQEIVFGLKMFVFKKYLVV